MPAMAGANGLLDAYHQAQQQDQTFQAAVHQRDASIEAKPQAWSALLPQLSGTGGYERDRLHILQAGGAEQNTASPVPTSALDWYTTRSYQFNLSQKVFDWSAFQTVAQSDQQVAQAEATFRSAEQSLITRTASAYFAVLSAQDTLRADLDAQTSFKQQLLEARKKFDVGLAAITDVRNAQAAYDSGTSTVIADRAAMDNAKRALALVVGQPVSAIASLHEEIPLVSPNPADVEQWSKAAGTDNPDLMAAFYNAEAARKQVAINRGKYLPTVSASGTLNRSDSHSEFGDDALDDAYAVTVTWNIFQGGLVQSQVRQAAATYQQNLAQYELQRRTVDQNTRNDYEGVMSGIAGVKANRLAVVSNQTSVDATTVGLRVGTQTEINLLTARQALAAAQKSYYQSRYGYLNSFLALKQDAGRLTEHDLEEVDRLVDPAPTPSPAVSEAETVIDSATPVPGKP
jgi:outer membrane protein